MTANRFINFACFKFHRLCILHAVLSILCLQSSIAQNKSCHVYNDHGGVVNITDSQTSPQIQVYNRRLDLFCHAENFCQIEWLKNGIPMEGFVNPWNFTSDVQGNWMEMPPTPDNNQTLTFDRLYCDAEGEWTCVVSGESGMKVTRTMEIVITEVELEGDPVFEAHNNCENMEAEFGDEVRLFCPCKVNDASHDVVLEWFKWVNDTENGVKTYTVSDEKIEEGLGVGEWVNVTNGTSFTLLPPELKVYSKCENLGQRMDSYIGQSLKINKLSGLELGTYKIIATRMDADNKGKKGSQILEVRKKPPPEYIPDSFLAKLISVILSLILIMVALMSILWYFGKTDIKLYIKDRYGTIEEGDGKTNDAFIVYSETDDDLNFALHMGGALQKKGYVVFIRDIHTIPGSTLVEELLTELKDSRRCILVISPDFLQARHAALQLEVAEGQMLQQQSKIIPILFKSVSTEDVRLSKGLKRIVSILKALKWDDGENAKNERVFKELLLRMPRVNPDNLQRPSDMDMPLRSTLVGGNYGQSLLRPGSESVSTSRNSLVTEEDADNICVA